MAVVQVCWESQGRIVIQAWKSLTPQIQNCVQDGVDPTGIKLEPCLWHSEKFPNAKDEGLPKFGVWFESMECFDTCLHQQALRQIEEQKELVYSNELVIQINKKYPDIIKCRLEFEKAKKELSLVKSDLTKADKLLRAPITNADYQFGDKIDLDVTKRRRIQYDRLKREFEQLELALHKPRDDFFMGIFPISEINEAVLRKTGKDSVQAIEQRLQSVKWLQELLPLIGDPHKHYRHIRLRQQQLILDGKKFDLLMKSKVSKASAASRFVIDVDCSQREANN